MKRFVIITGLSGAGKSKAVKSFEDMGYFCIDNLPAPLIPKFADMCNQPEVQIEKVALVIDIRGGLFLQEMESALEKLKKIGIRYEILFLEATDEVLISRFKESRRNHPLAPHGVLSEGILEEKKRLAEMRGQADKIIDTSRMRESELKKVLLAQWSSDQTKLSISIVSFGYKYGVPTDMDLLMDVRFLANPYYIEELRPLTGEEKAVQDYVLQFEESQEFLEQYTKLLLFLLPNYKKEGKSHVSIGIGCTGGQHRSVVLAIRIGEILRENGYPVLVTHRDR